MESKKLITISMDAETQNLDYHIHSEFREYLKRQGYVGQERIHIILGILNGITRDYAQDILESSLK